MTENKRYEKRMNFNVSLPDERCFKNEYCIVDEARDRYEALSINEIVDRLNEQEELIKRLKTIREEQTETILKQKRKIKELEQENKMLKTTISRNEAYIYQIKTIGKWSNTGDVE